MDKNRLAISTIAIAIIGLSALTFGCASPAATPTPASGSATPSPLSGVLAVTGSTSVGPYAEELAAAFDAKNGNRTSTGVSQVGSGPGIKAVIDGTADVGMSSRNLTADEQSKGLEAFKICDDGIAIVTNGANPVKSLTIGQVRDIYAGSVTNWKQVGGDDAAIIVVTREAGSGTRDGFESIVMQKKANITAKAIQQGSTGAVSTYVAGSRYAIGYVSYGSLDAGQVNAIAIDGVQPSVATIKDRTYPVQRPFLLVTRGQPSGLASAFIDYVLGPEGQAMLAKHNLVTL